MLSVSCTVLYIHPANSHTTTAEAIAPWGDCVMQFLWKEFLQWLFASDFSHARECSLDQHSQVVVWHPSEDRTGMLPSSKRFCDQPPQPTSSVVEILMYTHTHAHKSRRPRPAVCQKAACSCTGGISGHFSQILHTPWCTWGRNTQR